MTENREITTDVIADYNKAIHDEVFASTDPTLTPEYRINLGDLMNGLYDFLGSIVFDESLMAIFDRIETELPREYTDGLKEIWGEKWNEEETEQMAENVYQLTAMTPAEILGIRKLEAE